MARRSLRTSTFLALGGLAVFGALSSLVTWGITDSLEGLTHVTDVAGRQRLLAERCARLALEGPAAASRAAVTMARFEQVLVALREGGTAPRGGGRTWTSLEPLRGEAPRRALAAVEEAWRPLRALVQSATTGTARPSTAEVETLTTAVVRFLDALVVAHETETERRITLFRRLDYGVHTLGFLLLAALLYVVLREALHPIAILEAAARRMEAGDFSAPVRVPVENELGHLAAAVERMRIEVRDRMSQRSATILLAQEILNARTLDAVVAAAFETLRSEVACEGLALLVPGDEGNLLELRAAKGNLEQAAGEWSLALTRPEGQELVAALASGRPLIVAPGVAEGPGRALAGLLVFAPGLAWLAAVPVLGERRSDPAEIPPLLGALLVARSPWTPSGAEWGFLSLAAFLTLNGMERVLHLHEIDSARARHQDLFEGVPVGLYRSTPGGHILDANPALAQILGVANRRQLLGATATSFYPDPAQREILQGRLEEEGRLPAVEVQMRRADGQLFWARDAARVVRDEQGRVLWYEGSLIDVTEQKEAEEALRDAQRLASIGTLASGVAHFFNNLTTVILGRTELLRSRLPPNDPASSDLTEIAHAARRVATLTHDLLAFGQRQLLQPRQLDPNALLAGLRGLLVQALGETISLELDLPPRAGLIEVDRNRLEQILLHMATNARDAMPKGGRLRIAVRDLTLGSAAAMESELPRGDYVEIAVADSGRGIPAELLPRIFDPFFTTKERATTTGLGLASAYGIIRQSGGTIRVESEVGVGTTFRILLPRAGEPLVSAIHRA